MITAQLMGGLGNQLFQVCAVVSAGLQFRRPFYFLDSSELTVGRTRPTYWNSFMSGLRPFLKSTVASESFLLQERAFTYSPIVLPETAKNVTLCGYYQSPKYFEKHFGVIRTLLQLDSQISVVAQKYPYDYKNTVALHLRLDDYKTLANHPVLSVDYYIKALLELQRETGRPGRSWTVLIFGQEVDDADIRNFAETLQARLSAEGWTDASDSISLIDYNIPDHEQLLCMSLCAHYVIANSTFSWWAAYIGTSTPAVVQGGDQKHVYYPLAWFGTGAGAGAGETQKHSTADLFPKEWIGVSC